MIKVVLFAAIGIIALANAAGLHGNYDASMPSTPLSTISGEDCTKLGIRSPVTGQCFVYVKVPKLFPQAEAFCQTVYKGHLASIHNSFDNLVVAAYASDLAFGPVDPFYIGLNSLTSANSTWEDGTPVDYTNFGENNNNGAKCTTVDVKTGTWIKSDCFRTLVNFVCSV